MMWTTHLVGGALAAVLAQRAGLQPGVEPLLLSAAAALIPDLDHPKSFVGSRMRPFSDVVAGVFGHRGITHSLFAIIMMSLLAVSQSVAGWITASIGIGYLSHLLLDALTPQGLPLLYPRQTRYGIAFVTTGGLGEACFAALLAYSLFVFA